MSSTQFLSIKDSFSPGLYKKRKRAAVKGQKAEVIYLEEIRSIQEFMRIREDWKRLFLKSSKVTPFQSWEWNYAVIKEFTSSEKPKIIAGYNKKNEIVGIAPFKLSNHAFSSIKILEFIGSGPSDYLDFIVDEEYRLSFSIKVFNFIRNSKEWNILNLISLKEETRNLVACFLPVEISSQMVCPCIDLPDTMHEYEKEINKRELKNIKKQLRKLLPENRLTYVITKSPENLKENINCFMELHQRRHKSKGERGKFCTKTRRERFLHMSKLLCEAGMLSIEMLKIDSVIASINFILVLNNKKYNYLSGMNPVFSQFKPGKLLIYYMVEDAIKKGYKVFDFMQGDEEYKYFWTNKEIQLYSAVYSRSRLSFYLWRKLGTLKNQLYCSSIIKNSYQKFYGLFQF
jgi:CelD/BcsL family acetyltransferase involved in cellulose biosynthesis